MSRSQSLKHNGANVKNRVTVDPSMHHNCFRFRYAVNSLVCQMFSYLIILSTCRSALVLSLPPHRARTLRSVSPTLVC